MSCSTYSGDPATSPKDATRFLIGDTEEGNFVLTDDEINYIINQANGNENYIKYHLYTKMSIYYGNLPTSRKLGPQQESYTDRAAHFAALAEAARKRMAASGLTPSKVSAPRIFWKNQQSNPPWPNPGCRRRWPYV